VRVKGFPFGKGSFAHVDKKLSGALDTFEANLETLSEQVDADLVHVHTWYAHLGGILAKDPLRHPAGAYGAFAGAAASVEARAAWLWLRHVVVDRTHLTRHGRCGHCRLAGNQGRHPGAFRHRPGEDYGDLQRHQRRPVPSDRGDDRAGKIRRRSGQKPIVLFVGRITRQKGIVHLVNAVQYINPTRADRALCRRTRYQGGARGDGSRGQAHSPGRFQQRDLDSGDGHQGEAIELYSHATVFCCPSIYEPFGIINLEAMACRTAVVASSVGGIKEVVVDGVTGFLVPLEQWHVAPFEPVNPDVFSRDLAAAINKVLDNPELAESMAAAGQQRAREVFSWSSIAQQTKKLYDSLVK
jgi:starch synthase